MRKKKINPERFKADEPARFAEFGQLFDLMHPDSFTAQKLFLINQIRRRYPLPPPAPPPTADSQDTPPPPTKRPVIVRK
ncbi:MAG: hypothetical protein MUC97_06490 [Bernardetiaceae bacterium]|nr:hypothetical protein [Bernardetiaceae bacterium]